MWTLADDCHTDCTPTHGYEPTREAAMAAFAKSWRRRKAVMEESLVCGHITLLPVSPFRSLSSSSLARRRELGQARDGQGRASQAIGGCAGCSWPAPAKRLEFLSSPQSPGGGSRQLLE